MAKPQTENFFLNVTYGGKQYRTPCILMESTDSIIFQDSKFRDLFYNTISRDTSVATILINDSTIVYDKIKPLDGMVSKSTRASNPLESSLQIWDDTHFQDRSCKFCLDAIHIATEVSNLRYFNNFNDKTSSLRLYNGRTPMQVYLYEDKDFSGDFLYYCVVSTETTSPVFPPEVVPRQYEIGSLKKIPKRGGAIGMIRFLR